MGETSFFVHVSVCVSFFNVAFSFIIISFIISFFRFDLNHYRDKEKGKVII